MEWFNGVGLIFITAIIIPNIIFAIRHKEDFENKWDNKVVMILEQIGRFGCFGFMIFNIPGTYFGWWTREVFLAYLIIDSLLVMLYCIAWIILWKKNNLLRALILSIIPSLIFLFSGVMSRSILLTIASIIFAPTHILISYKNATK